MSFHTASPLARLIPSSALLFAALVALAGCDDDGGSGDDGASGGASSSSSGGGASSGGASSSSGATSSSSGSSSGQPKTLTGTVTWNGKTEPCSTSHQIFPASQQFSVLCQTEGVSGVGSVLVQVTFKDEASARSAGEFTVLEGVAFSPEDHPDPRTAHSSVIDDEHAYDATEESTGTMTVSASGDDHVLSITEQQQFVAGEEIVKVVSATITF